MSKTVFPYPGGKARHADWILEHFPDHTAYVEVFGGGAGLLVNKSPSKVEVYNDVDGNVVAFFRALRDRPDELVDWLEKTPYSRDFHSDFRSRLYGDADAPDDDVERGGMFFYLQYSSFSGKRDASFAYPRDGGKNNWARYHNPGNYANKRRLLSDFASRFEEVTLENADWRDVLETYDSESTLFYLDPPYLGTESVYGETFDHADFARSLSGLSADWILSYSDIPDAMETVGPGLDSLFVASKGSTKMISSGGDQTERLIMNFDPDEPTVGGWDRDSVQAGLQKWGPET